MRETIWEIDRKQTERQRDELREMSRKRARQTDIQTESDRDREAS